MDRETLLLVLSDIGARSADGVLAACLPQKKIEYVSKALQDMFDISHPSFAKEAAFFINHVVEDDLHYLEAEYARLLKAGSLENVEFRIKAHDQRIKHISVSTYLIDAGNFIVAFFRDITNIREHENYIINYGGKKNTLLDMVTHNLSVPLAISKNLIQSLEQATGKMKDERLHEHVRLIKENTQQCIELINDFLEEEHLVSENIHTKRNRFDIIEKINTVLERFRKSYPDHRFALNSEVLEISVGNDDVKFLQVINNLLSNAVKWSPAGSTIQTHVSENEKYVIISVTDSGIGIPDRLKPFLFQRNTPASRPGLKGEKSIAMGLYIVRKLVILMGGEITFTSEEGKGSIFNFSMLKSN